MKKLRQAQCFVQHEYMEFMARGGCGNNLRGRLNAGLCWGPCTATAINLGNRVRGGFQRGYSNIGATGTPRKQIFCFHCVGSTTTGGSLPSS